MRRWVVMASALACGVGTGGPAWARPMDAALQQQLLTVFHRYEADIAAGHLDQALALRTADVQTTLTQQLKTPEERSHYLSEVRQIAASQLQIRHASVNDAGEKALLVAQSPSGQSELDLDFAREGGVWKLGEMAQGPGPSQIAPCRDTSYQPISAYDTSQVVSLVGRIDRVEFQSDHTLVVVLSGDAETCAFLPPQAALKQHGLDPGILQPYRVAQISGLAERDNPKKVLVNNITVRSAE